MRDDNYGSDGNEGEARERFYHHEPAWKRMHHSLLFWLGVVMVSVAIAIYVLSDNLAMLPHGQPQPALSTVGGK